MPLKNRSTKIKYRTWEYLSFELKSDAFSTTFPFCKGINKELLSAYWLKLNTLMYDLSWLIDSEGILIKSVYWKELYRNIHKGVNIPTFSLCAVYWLASNKTYLINIKNT